MSYKRFLRPALAVAAVLGVAWAGVALAAPSKSHQTPAAVAIAPPSVEVTPSAEPSSSPPPSPTAPVPQRTLVAAAKPASTASVKLATVIREVKKLVGSPYVWGATGPDTFDCAGLTQYVYKKVGVKLVNYVPTQKDKAKLVPRSKARPGDLLFFMDGDFAYHVGIYAGHHKMYDAPTEGQTVGLHEIWDDGYLVGQLV
jgi:cell wall-associated NlpC family hydrolase